MTLKLCSTDQQTTFIVLLQGNLYCSWLVRKNYFVVFTALIFPYVMLYPNLMAVQKEGLPFTQGIITLWLTILLAITTKR